MTGRGLLTRLGLVVAVLALGAQAASAESGQTSVATLTGEQLASFFQPCSANSSGADPSCFTSPHPPLVQATCNPDGSSTLHLATTGYALGPYPGTFSVSITVQLGPQNGAPLPETPIGFPAFPGIQEGTIGFPSGNLATVSETFHIDSPSTGSTVDGFKTLLADPGNVGVCRTFANELPAPANPFFPIPITGYFLIAHMDALAYGATIQTPTGSYGDEGTARAYVDNTFATCCPNPLTGTDTNVNSSDGLFVQLFTSGLPVALALKPGEGCGDKNHIHVRLNDCG